MVRPLKLWLCDTSRRGGGGGGGARSELSISGLAGHTLIHRIEGLVLYRNSGFVLLSQLFQDAVGIFIVGGVLEINARAIYSG